MSRQRNMSIIETSEYVTIGELVRLTGLRYSTLKFYTEEGILSFIQEDENLIRKYHRINTIKDISIIKTLKLEGKTIPQIKDVLTQIKKISEEESLNITDKNN